MVHFTLGSMAQAHPLFFNHRRADEVWRRFQQEGAAIVSESLAYHRNLDVGSEIELLTEVGVFGELPDWEGMYLTDVADGLYDGTELVWPAE